MSFNKLFYNTVICNDLGSSIEFAPQFLCPKCKYIWSPSQTLSVNPDGTLEFNQLITFPIPDHNNPETSEFCVLSGKIISLFIAIHKDATHSIILISTRSIPDNWWMKGQ